METENILSWFNQLRSIKVENRVDEKENKHMSSKEVKRNSGQDDGEGKRHVCLLLWPYQNYD